MKNIFLFFTFVLTFINKRYFLSFEYHKYPSYLRLSAS